MLLLLTAFIWGTAFVAQSEGMNYIGPFTYCALRNILGGLVLIPVIAVLNKTRSIKNNDKKEFSLSVTIKGGIVCGIVLCVAGALQQVGIVYTTAGKAGFITAFYIIGVPLVEFFLFKKKSVMVWVCAFIAMCGLYLLCVKEGFKINRGDLLIFLCALGYTVHILVIDYFNEKGADGVMMSCIQFFVAAILMILCMFIFETPDINNIFSAKYTILYAGVMSSGVAFTLQIVGQRYTDATSASLIMSLESVFAALSGWLILKEVMDIKEFSGCVLVFVAVILAQLKDGIKNTSQKNKQGVAYEKASE